MKTKLFLVAASAMLLAACSSNQQPTTSVAPTTVDPTTSVAPTTSAQSKSFTLTQTYKFAENTKTIDLKPFISFGAGTTIADLEFSSPSGNTITNGVLTAANYGFNSVYINVKDSYDQVSFHFICGPTGFLNATYVGKTPSGRDGDMKPTYEGAAVVSLTITSETAYSINVTAGKGWHSGAQVDIPAASFSGTLAINKTGFFDLTNNEAGWSALKGNFMTMEAGFGFRIGGFPNEASSANLFIPDAE